MALITRSDKGSKLTIAEMDGNLEYLQANGFVDGEYTQTVVGTGAIIDLANFIYDPDPLTDAAVGNYTVSPVSGSGTGAELTLNVKDDRGALIISWGDSTIVDGGSGYAGSDELVISSNDIGGTQDEPITLFIPADDAISVTQTSTIAVSSNNVDISTASLTVTGSMSVSETVTANGIQGITLGGESLTISNPQGDAVVTFVNLPTADPQVPGQLWNDSGSLKVSQ